MSAQSTPTEDTSYSDRIPTSAELDRFLRRLNERDKELSDSLARHTATTTAAHKPARASAAVSFDLTDDTPWIRRPRQNSSESAHPLQQSPRGQQRGQQQHDYNSSRSHGDENRHPLGDAGQPPPPQSQPQQPQQLQPATGTLELLLQQMQRDRQASDRNTETLIQTLAANNLRKANMDAIPQCPQMHHKEDIVEYIQVFEETQLARGNPREHWCHTLIPLLNKTCKAVVVGLPASSKYNYALLKAELLATASHQQKHSSKSFWEHQKSSGSTWRETANTLIKKVRLFTPGPTIEDVRSQIATEKLLQLLPFRAQSFVREREPKTVTEAADLASSFFYSHNMDELHWETDYTCTKRNSSSKDSFKEKPHQKYSNRHHYPGKWTGGSHDRQQAGQSPNSGTNSFTKDSHSHHNQQGQSSRNYPYSNKGDPPKVTCIKCGEKGHKADACLKINLVNIPCLFGSFTAPPILKPGIIDGKPVQLFMDSGADSAIIAKELLPPTYTQCMPVTVTGVNSQDKPKLCQTALFPAQIDGHDVQMFAAVVEGKDLPHPFIIGRSVPGLDITWDINISKPGEKDPSVSSQQSPETTTPAQQANLHLELALTKPQSTPSLLDLDNFTAADIAIARTRAQTKREQRQQQQDDAATALSTAPITLLEDIPDDIPDLEDTPDLVDRPSKVSQDSNSLSHPQTNSAPSAATPAFPPDSMPDPESPPLGREPIDSFIPPSFEGTAPSTQPADRPGAVEETTTPEGRHCQTQPDYTIITSPFSSADLIREQKADASLKPLWAAVADPLQTDYIHKNSILYAVNLDHKSNENPHKIVVPTSLRQQVLNIGHACSGHFGSKKTKAHIEAHFYWPGIGKDIQQHCKACKTCAQFNSHKPDIQPLKPVPLVHTPWHKLAMDIVGPFTRTTSGYQYVLTLVDMATRFPEAIPLKRVDSTATAEGLLKVFSAYGTPQVIVHDNGGNFTSQLMTSVLKALGISQITVSPYHPQANGMIERLNGTLKKAIKKAGATETTWDKWLHFVLHAIRITDHSATGHTPYELLFGRMPNTPISSLKEALEGSQEDIPQPITDYLASLHTTMANAKEAAEAVEAKAKKASKAYHDSRKKAKASTLEPGTSVLCFEPKKKKGLSATWLGPFTITKRLGDLTYLIDMGHGKQLRRHRNALKVYTPNNIDISTIILAQPDEEAADELTLGPAAEEPHKTNIPRDVKGIEHLEQTQRDQLLRLVTNYSDVFSDTPGVATLPAYDLDTGQTTPICRKPYRPALQWKPKIEQELQNLLDAGIIRPSSSPWSSPIMAVPKKTGDVRICIDFRAINQITTPDNYPLPRIDDLLAIVSSANYLTTLDLTQGYHQIELTPSTIPKTAFIAHCGKFEYVRLPFGLCNAPAHFQRCMDATFADTPAKAYIDDVIIATDTWHEHISILSQVLSKCREKHISLKLKKCCFTSATIDYLGHTIGSGSILPQHAKVEAIMDFPQPTTRKQVKSFLGLIGYYRQHIPAFATVTQPLNAISGNTSPRLVQWNSTLEKSFKEAKKAFLDAPIISAPNLNLPYHMHTDACSTGIGAALTQVQEGQTKHIAFFSKHLTLAEAHYSATELETFAITCAMKHFAVYLHGSFTNIYSDHKPLQHLPTMVNDNKRLMRWVGTLQQFPHKILYVPGKDNIVADSLSRSWDITPTWGAFKEGGDVGLASSKDSVPT